MHDGFGWQFTVPTPGFVAYVRDAAVLAVYDAGWHVGAWPVAALRIGSRIVLGAAPVAVSVPAGGSIIDSELRSAFAELLLALAAAWTFWERADTARRFVRSSIARRG